MKRMVFCVLMLAVFLSFAVYSEAEVYEGYFIDQKSPSDSFGAIRPIPEYIFAQSFIPSEDNVAAVSFQTGPSPQLDFYPYSVIELRPDDGGFPGEVVLSSTSSFTTNLQPLGATAAIFDPPVNVIPGETYYFVIYKSLTAPGNILIFGATGEDYTDGQGYYKVPSGDWQIGVASNPLPPGADYGFTEYYYGDTVVPIAYAGEDIYAGATETVILDASDSYDPDGTIADYRWRTLPVRNEGPYYTGEIIYSGPESSCEAQALGRLEEVIELTVTDNLGVSATDTMTIWHTKVENIDIQQGPPGPPGPEGPPGPQGEEGPAGVTPDEIQMIYENRELLKQLPQLQKDLEALQQQTQ